MTAIVQESAVEAVLFDLDGTLMDTPRAIAEQLVMAVQQVTGHRPAVSHAQELVGRPLPELCAMLSCLAAGSMKVGEIVEAYRSLYRTKVVPAAGSLVFPGVIEGLTRLRASGIAMAVVTSKQSDSARLILEAADMSGYFQTVVGVDDTALPKPNPDPALLALQRLNVRTDAAVFVGDTAHDIGTAQSVPMRSIAVTYGVGAESTLSALHPDRTAHDFDTVVDLILSLAPSDERQNR